MKFVVFFCIYSVLFKETICTGFILFRGCDGGLIGYRHSSYFSSNGGHISYLRHIVGN